MQLQAFSWVGLMFCSWNIFLILATARLIAPPMSLTTPLRSPTTPLGAPLILSPRIPVGSQLSNGLGPPPLIAPAEAGLLYAPYADYHQYATLSPALLTDYSGIDHTGAGGLFAR